MSHDLAKQLQKRENMLSHSLSTFDVSCFSLFLYRYSKQLFDFYMQTLKEHKEFMENILYEQATGTHSFRERSELSIMKY